MTYSALDPQANRAAVQIRPAEFKTIAQIDAEIERLTRLRATLAAGPSLRAMLDGVVATVCRLWDVEPDVLMGRGRFKAVSDARQAAMYVLYIDKGASSVDVGTLFNRDHGTVLNAVFAVEAKWTTDETFRRRFDHMRGLMGLRPWAIAGRVS